MKTPRDKYMHDPEYATLVNWLCAQIHACKFTPSEIREAAIFACILYEKSRIQYPLSEKVESALKILCGEAVKENEKYKKGERPR